MIETETSQIQKACEGDAKAFNALTSRYWDYVLSVVRGYINDEHYAADVVQETFVRALQTISKLKDRSKFRPWLSAIARNIARDQGTTIARDRSLFGRLDVAGVSTAIQDPSDQTPIEEIHKEAEKVVPKAGVNSSRLAVFLRYAREYAEAGVDDVFHRSLEATARHECAQEGNPYPDPADLSDKMHAVEQGIYQLRRTGKAQQARELLFSRRKALLGFGVCASTLAFGRVGEASEFPHFRSLQAFDSLISHVRQLRQAKADIRRCRNLLEPALQVWLRKFRSRPNSELARYVLEAADLGASFGENALDPKGEQWLAVMHECLPYLGELGEAWRMRYIQQRARFAFLRGNPHRASAIIKAISGEDARAFLRASRWTRVLDHDLRGRRWSFRSSFALQVANHLISTGLPSEGEKWLAALVNDLREQGDVFSAAWREAVLLTVQAERNPGRAMENGNRILELRRHYPSLKSARFVYVGDETLLLRCHIAAGRGDAALEVVESLSTEINQLGYPQTVLGLLDACKRAQGSLRDQLAGAVRRRFGQPPRSVLSASWPA